MSSYSSDRRSVLKIFGAIGATCAYPFASDELFGQEMVHQHAPSAPPSVALPRFLNESDFAMLSRITDLIIPATDSPGAVGAGVPAYIDLVLARNTDQQVLFADGLRWLDAEADRAAGKKFIGLSEAQQLAILEPLCEAADANSGVQQGRSVQFFALVKSMTADGYYTSRVGLIEELGYKGNTPQMTFPSCSK